MPRTVIQWTSTIAFALVLILIFIGGLVRATGAGLGCPDWPRCWGSWWPPSSAEEIQLANINVAKIPAEFRDAPDPRVFFNKDKMWIEYLNRLWGVLSGFGVIALVLSAIPRLRDKPLIFWLSVLTLIAMLFQGWLGALVVRSGLKQSMITIHMAVALVILGLLVHIHFLAFGSKRAAVGMQKIKPLFFLCLAALIFTLIQIFGGTHVRESLDLVAETMPSLSRSQWLSQLGWYDHFHRIFSWTVLLSTIGIFRLARCHSKALCRRATFAISLVISQIALGISLAYFALPPVSQFLHLGFAASLAVLLYRILLDSLPHESPNLYR